MQIRPPRPARKRSDREREGLIKSTSDAADGRGRKLLSMLPAGKAALKAWIRRITDPDLISEVFDPLRSRIFFLGMLGETEQVSLVKDILSALEAYLASTREHLAERSPSDDPFEYLGAVGGVLNAESRMEMLQAVLDRISEKE